MTTIPKPGPASALVLLIDGTAYALTSLATDPRLARSGIRLSKVDGTTYDVAVTVHGCQCSCPDYIFRREAKGEVCKHIRCLQDHGLLPAIARQPRLARSRREAEFT